MFYIVTKNCIFSIKKMSRFRIAIRLLLSMRKPVCSESECGRSSSSVIRELSELIGKTGWDCSEMHRRNKAPGHSDF